MYNIKVTEGNDEKMKKENQMRISIYIFIYTIHFAYLKVYTKFENTSSKTEKSVTEISIGEKEK